MNRTRSKLSFGQDRGESKQTRLERVCGRDEEQGEGEGKRRKCGRMKRDSETERERERKRANGGKRGQGK